MTTSTQDPSASTQAAAVTCRAEPSPGLQNISCQHAFTCLYLGVWPLGLGWQLMEIALEEALGLLPSVAYF